ncbi:hypothetical protein GCM10010156_06500 [Planobispora rosea]|uniref:PPM-type phosphatase domain-containing protein n=1 Tax=Planobispora rosea TaxID=35762 RepID=A0A8J3RYC7_PLARO|nr:protein phosphatase 2C domain-containing protein [Planobispora rosea]GGS50476.1 hypothetical protein GCM10010156_06500 [Planobispora rosea]GIH82521.1 hypothetical protein Pro02_09290 [Planobispora rosea]
MIGVETGACPRCGEGVRPGESFCECCGQRLEAARCVRCGPAPVDPDGYCELCGLRQPAGNDHVEVEAGGAAGVSDRGLRHARNEDAMALVAVDGLTAGVVCDGVSSSPRPETASAAAAEIGAATLLAELRSGADPAAATRTAAARAAAAVAALASSPDDAPACTYVSAVVESGAITVGWVGDSRAYWLRAEDSVLLTEDDVAAPGVLSAWLGADAGAVEARVRTLAPEGPGVLLVCSDGLWGYLEEARALAPLATGDAPPEAARALVRHALAAGGRDNVTVLVIPYGPPPGPAPADLGRSA